MSDGVNVPTYHAALGSFGASEDGVLVLRNHAVPPGVPSRFGPFSFHNERFDPERHLTYDAGADGQKPAYGAVTWFRYDPQRLRVTGSGLVVGGLLGVSAGVSTPWGTWLCAEGSVQSANERYGQDHGFAFECAPPPGAPTARPIPSLGRFCRGGLAVWPGSGIVYQTEAEPDGLLYRYIPEIPGRLAEGGRLEALAMEGPVGAPRSVRWVELDAEAFDLRHAGVERGATRFAQGGSLVATPEGLYIACREGGPEGQGQVWRYTPSPFEGGPEEQRRPGRMEPVFSGRLDPRFAGLENMAAAPWGDLLISGTGPDGAPTLYGVSVQGEAYPLARNVYNQASFSGMAFSPDAQTLFLNLDTAAVTLAVSGPWQSSA